MKTVLTLFALLILVGCNKPAVVEDNGPTNVAEWLPENYEAPKAEKARLGGERWATGKRTAESSSARIRKSATLSKLLGEKRTGPAEEPDTTVVVTGNPKRFETVEAYFKDGNPNPLSHRKGEPNYERRVSDKTKREVKARDGNCCLVCGSTRQLEVDHRIALMNGGNNSVSNLGTLCDDCHNKKTRYDYSIRKRRQKEASRR